MRFSTSALPLLALSAVEVTAFPALAKDAINLAARAVVKENRDLPRVIREEREKRAKRQATFDAQAQYVSTTGAHAFIAPNLPGGDQRGPVCMISIALKAQLAENYSALV